MLKFPVVKALRFAVVGIAPLAVAGCSPYDEALLSGVAGGDASRFSGTGGDGAAGHLGSGGTTGAGGTPGTGGTGGSNAGSGGSGGTGEQLGDGEAGGSEAGEGGQSAGDGRAPEAGGGTGGAGGGVGGADGGVDAAVLCMSSSKGSGTEGLIDDLDDGNSNIPPVDGRAGSWYFATDGTGTTTPSAGQPTPEPGGEVNLGLHVSGSNLTQWGASLGVAVAAPGACYDASAYGGISIALQGSGKVLLSVQTAPVNAEPPAKQDQYKTIVTLTPAWKDWSFVWSDFHQSGYPGTTVLPFDTQKITGIAVDPYPANPLSFDFWVDNVAFSKKP